ncbi:metallophosphoesterase family protein [Desulfatibacillum aliphaticivorans]|uniref:metallophosphoesterase family protein n=1 Tax=Desulfatibacillum aliphaticivorans TaxID=218208 RepID=UPI00040B3854|nr:metallophosphoesterase [Desulfatibacillum aliphaticivorans]
MPKKTYFQIAHLTDLHLTKKDSMARSEPKLFGKLKGMNKSFRAIMASPKILKSDWLAFTGDITDNGDLDTWKMFWDVISKANFSDKCSVIPGNHDVCNLGFFPASHENDTNERIERVRKGLKMGKQEVRFPWVKQIHEAVALIGIDSCNHGNFTGVTNAVGKIGFHQLEKLARDLKKIRHIPVKILMLHHSPNIPETWTEEARGLKPTSKAGRWGHEVPEEDRRALRLLCITNDVRLILHGHLHRQEDRRVNGVRIIGGAATTAPSDPDEKTGFPVTFYKVYTESEKKIIRQEQVLI